MGVMCGMCGGAWAEQSDARPPPTPPPLQEPELDPKPILELPLEKLAQKLQADELSLESVLCSYLEEVMGWGQDTTLGLGLERGMSPVVGGQV